MVEVKLDVSKGTVFRFAFVCIMIVAWAYMYDWAATLRKQTSNAYLELDYSPDWRFSPADYHEVYEWLMLRSWVVHHDYITFLWWECVRLSALGWFLADVLTMFALRLPEEHWARSVLLLPLFSSAIGLLQNVLLVLITYFYPAEIFLAQFVGYLSPVKHLGYGASVLLTLLVARITFLEEKRKFE
jgi:hypothetical protein